MTATFESLSYTFTEINTPRGRDRDRDRDLDLDRDLFVILQPSCGHGHKMMLWPGMAVLKNATKGQTLFGKAAN
jgi:hypothetical protein